MKVHIEYEIDKPKQLVRMDLGNLVSMCQQHLNNIEKGKIGGDETHYIYEQAMMAVFGRDVFDFINERRRL